MTRKKLIVASAVVAAALCAGVTAWHYCSGEAGRKQSAQTLLAPRPENFWITDSTRRRFPRISSSRAF